MKYSIIIIIFVNLEKMEMFLILQIVAMQTKIAIVILEQMMSMNYHWVLKKIQNNHNHI